MDSEKFHGTKLLSVRSDARAVAQGSYPAALSSVRKACRILKAIASVPDPRLTSIAQLTQLDKATVLRLLEMLAEEGFATRDGISKQFALGPELTAVGAVAAARVDLRQIAQPSLLRLTAEFEDTVMLFVPSGHESLCVAVELGTFPLRANYIGVGGRRILGVSAGSMALLAALPQAEYEAVMPVVRRSLGPYPKLSPKLVEQMAAETRHRGYAESIDLLVDRVSSIGVAVLDARGRPACAFGISALSDRIVGRRDTLVAALKREAEICRIAWMAATGDAEPRQLPFAPDLSFRSAYLDAK
jgi:DNA-binding IclR family transcriptional regulator